MPPSAKKAAALRYERSQDGAPKVVAKGSGLLAERIIEKAEAFDVPLFANRELVDSLIGLDLDREIPPQLYEATVQVFVWLMRCEQERGR